jgi:hypothetical protein
MGVRLLISLFSLLCGFESSLGAAPSVPIPSFPLQLTASIEIMAHLIPEDAEYPPRTRSMRIYYDYIQKLARADIEAGYEAAKQYYRFYNEKVEYMVRSPPINDCNRAYLGEKMPFPDLSEAVFVSTQSVENVLCNYFVHSDSGTRVHIYLSAVSGEPVKLTVSSVEQNSDGSESSTDLLTYLYSEVVLGPPSSAVFQLPQPYAESPRASCERQVGGFPYLHVFHYFVRF